MIVLIWEYFLSYSFHFIVYLAIVLLIYSAYKAKLHSNIFYAVRKNKIFFSVLLVVAAIVSFYCFPFEPLVYYDEQNYLLAAHNIIEHGINAFCAVDNDGKCLEYRVSPHGMGANSIYALLYNPNFDFFYVQISLFNFLMYILNALLIYVIAVKLFSNPNVARISAVLMLMMPYNIIYSTNVMPATLCTTFLLIAIYALVVIFKNRRKIEEMFSHKSAFFLLAAALILLSSLRVEYAACLSLFLAFVICAFFIVLIKYRNIPKKPWSNLFKTPASKAKLVMLLLMLLMSYAYSFFYIYQKLIVKIHGPSPKLGLGFLNLSYVQYYIDNWAFAVLSAFFIAYLLYFVLRCIISRANHKIKMLSPLLFILLASIFFIYLFFYSVYNFPYTYRFIVPITSIYILFSSAGMNLIIEKIFRRRMLISSISLIIIIMLCLSLAGLSFVKKDRMIDINDNAAYFVEVLNEINNMHNSGIDNQFMPNKTVPQVNYYFDAGYLGEIVGMKNYLDQERYAKTRLKAGEKLYFLNSFFSSVEESPFADSSTYSYNMVLQDKKYNYNLYEIKLK